MSQLKLKLGTAGALEQAFETREADGWPAVTGTVRPALPREVEANREALAKSKDAVGTQAEFYARHLKSWDVCGDDGAPLPVTAEAVAALPYPVWLQLDRIVLGSGGGEVLGNGGR